jgi:large subunit ribosomal protein L11
LKQAAGVKRASMEPGRKIAGVVSIKHVYEIAKFKSEDINCKHMSIRDLCIRVLNSANRCGIKVVHQDLNPIELSEFLAQRKSLEEQELNDIAEKRASKRMKAASAAAAAIQAKQKK